MRFTPVLLHKESPYRDFDWMRWKYDPSGWNSNSPAFKEVIDRVKPELIIEVGTWKGASAIHMSRLTMAQIVCVDTWLGSLEFWTDLNDEDRHGSLQLKNGYPQVYYQFLANVCYDGKQSQITPFPATAYTAYRWFKRMGIMADLIYMDAGHQGYEVLYGIQDYWSILRPGGIMIGDDYDKPEWPDVKTAVDMFAMFKRQKPEIIGEKWIIQKS